MPDIACLNGNFMPLDEARVPVTDYGFLFGYGLFETLRIYRGHFFRLSRHLSRLEQSASVLHIPLNLSEIRDQALETVRRSGYADARVRITITLGPGNPVPDPASCQQPTVLILAVPLVPRNAEIYTRGWRVILADTCRDSCSLLSGLKTTAYLESLHARQTAHSRGADDALFLNEKGNLVESTSANLFVLSQETLQTPRSGSGLLPGVTREVVMEIAAGMGIPCVETDLPVKGLETATEAFLTNSLIELMPLSSFNDRKIGGGRPGAATLRLIQGYQDLVAKETA